jgi:hypothetical protein
MIPVSLGPDHEVGRLPLRELRESRQVREDRLGPGFVPPFARLDPGDHDGDGRLGRGGAHPVDLADANGTIDERRGDHARGDAHGSQGSLPFASP